MFKKSFINFQTKSALKSNKSKRENIQFSQVRKVGILHHFTSDKTLQAVYHFFDNLEKSGLTVKVLVIKDKKEVLTIPEFQIADTHELSFFGKWTNEAVLSFMENQFDILIHVNLADSELADNILAKSKAKCRVGKFHEKKEKYYELMISPENDNIQKLIDQIYHYIQKI